MTPQPRTENPCPAITEETPATVRTAARRTPRVLGLLVAALAAIGITCGFIQPAMAYTPAQMAQLIANEINAERHMNGLPNIGFSYRLQSAAHSHNYKMAHYNIMSHQLSGEPSLGSRISSANIGWTYCAENIAWTSSRSTQGALAVHRSMYNEHAPNDGHRLNILSRNVTYVGIDVIIDNTHGKLWITEDFARITR